MMRPDPFARAPASFHLWTCALDEPGAMADERLAALLAPDERQRAQRFRFAADRRRFVAAHAFLRLALSRHFDVAPRQWRFDRDAAGKPFVVAPDPNPAPVFSLSHSGGMAACLVGACGAVGVDVEKLEDHGDLRRSAPSIMTADELRALEALHGAAWTARFYEHWTLKEAYAKARGLGLALDPRRIGFALGRDSVIRGKFAESVGDDPSRWAFTTHRAIPAHVLSVAAPAASEIVVRRFAFENGAVR